MKRKLASALGLVATVGLVVSTSTASAQQALNISWDNGVNFATADKSVQGKLGARIFNDHYFTLSADKDLDAKAAHKDGTEMRDLLFWIKGTVNETLEYSFEEDFSSGSANLQETWVGLKKLPWGGLRVGHTTEPFGFEQIMGAAYRADMERGLPTALAPGRNTGVMLYGDLAEKVVNWQAGVFRETGAFGNESGKDDSLNYTARVFADPLFENEGETVVHAGLAYSRKQLDLDVQYKSAGEAHLGPVYVDTGKIVADSVDLFGGELLGIFGPFSVQSEIMQANVNRTGSSNVGFPSLYALASFFITGEHRNYKLGSGTIGPQKVLSPFIGGNGAGAFELTGRYSWLDLSDKDIVGGELSDFTAGLNWYLCTNARVMLNYVYADLKDVGSSNILENRFQVFF